VSEKRLPFRKYYAEGNSYVLVERLPYAGSVAMWVADCVRALECDGLILVESQPGDVTHDMRVFNADGSEAEMCGNGARAAAALICERDGAVPGDTVTVTCLGGTICHELLDRASWTFRAEMRLGHDALVEIGDGGRLVQFDTGAPHLIVFGPVPSGEEVAAMGEALCASRPGGTNVMFASHDDDGGLTVTPWERGVGPVLGCATGAAAAAIASEQVLGRPLDGGYVRQPGGAIEVEWDGIGGVLTMTGTARVVATGTVALDPTEMLVDRVPVTG
jgi:diaminopimelate epimerase